MSLKSAVQLAGGKFEDCFRCISTHNEEASQSKLVGQKAGRNNGCHITSLLLDLLVMRSRYQPTRIRNWRIFPLSDRAKQAVGGSLLLQRKKLANELTNHHKEGSDHRVVAWMVARSICRWYAMGPASSKFCVDWSPSEKGCAIGARMGARAQMNRPNHMGGLNAS